MKYLFLFLISTISLVSNAQYSIYEQFEYPYDFDRANFEIDTVNCSHNIWQIGRPQKVVFDSAKSYPNAIVTDTLNPVPPNDTSIFYLKIGGYPAPYLFISYFFKLDIDTNSTVKMEISGDNGLNWIDPMTEDTTYLFYWAADKPRFDTSTVGWTEFALNMDTWSTSWPGGPYTFPHYRTGDTVVYRFTYITRDSVESHDGWMLDNFMAENTGGVSVNELHTGHMQVFPNPSNGDISISNTSMSKNDRILVYDMAGKEVYRINSVKPTMQLPIPDGVYLLKYVGERETFINRIVISR